MNLGVRHGGVRRMEALLAARLAKTRRGPPFRRDVRFMLFMALMRLRTALPLRLLARLFAVAHATLWRWCNLVTTFLSGRFERLSGAKELIVDTTSTRVRCTDRVWYSGHRKQRVAKVQVQVLCDADGIVHAVSRAYPGRVHDKTIWNGEFGAIPEGATELPDKAYAGGTGDGDIRLRPIRRNERKWSVDPAAAKAFNAALSKRRVRIEHLFARLKSWRIIHHDYPMRTHTYDTTFRAIA